MAPAESCLVGAGPRLDAWEFERIRDLARRAFGLDLRPGKEQLVAARLGRLVRGCGLRSYRELIQRASEDRTGESLAAMIDALATNHTSFLRESDHFDFLRARVARELAGRDAVEVWSAACSTGEEVWTLAITLLEELPGRRIRVLATDISRKALAAARQGLYEQERCAGLPPRWIGPYFSREAGAALRVRPQVRELVSFARLNLVEPLATGRRFPVIFCRNVMIYFDADTQASVTRRLAERLEPGGYLFVGHAESLARFAHPLEYVRPAVYRKSAKRGGTWSRSS